MDQKSQEIDKWFRQQLQALLEQREVVIGVVKIRCYTLYDVRRQFCDGRTMGGLKPVLVRSPHVRLGYTYRLQYFVHSKQLPRGIPGKTRLRKGANNLPNVKLLRRHLRNVEYEIALKLLRELAVLDTYLGEIQDAINAAIRNHEIALGIFYEIAKPVPTTTKMIHQKYEGDDEIHHMVKTVTQNDINEIMADILLRQPKDLRPQWPQGE